MGHSGTDALGEVPVSPRRGIVSTASWGLGFLLSLIGDQLFTLALTFAALRTQSPAAVAGVVAAVSVSRGVVLLLGGALADRVSPRLSMAVADLGRTVIMLATAAVLLFDHYSVPVLVVVAIVVGALDGVFQPAALSLPGHIAAGDASAQSKISAVRTIARRSSVLLGGALAGGVIAASGPAGGFGVAGFLFLASVACLPFIRLVASQRDTSGVVADPTTPRKLVVDAVDGLRTVRKARGVGSVLIMIALLNIGFVGPMTAGVPVMSAHRGWGASGAGIILAAFGLGAATTGIYLFFRPVRRPGKVMLAGVAGMAVTLVAIGIVPGFWAVVISAVLMGVSSGSSGTYSNAIVTTNVPKDQMGRTQALFELTMEIVAPVSLAVAGAAATAGHASIIFVLGGLLAGIGVLCAGVQRKVRELEVRG